ncbi:MAG: hypothetical protein N2235_01660 [Fischerella sp.]|nr:hypothetical protein [Fischerella sp.]
MEFKPLFTGRLVSLAAPQPEDNQYFAKWSENYEYLQIMDNDPVRPTTPETWAEFQSSLPTPPNGFHFHLRTFDESP